MHSPRPPPPSGVRKTTLPRLRNGVKAATLRIEELERVRRGIPTFSQESPMVDYLCKVRDGQFGEIQALRADAASEVPLPSFFA